MIKYAILNTKSLKKRFYMSPEDKKLQGWNKEIMYLNTLRCDQQLLR
jgi:hypothetical protein